nr:leucine zipper domain-containing protein [Mycolicibacterium sediminis]
MVHGPEGDGDGHSDGCGGGRAVGQCGGVLSRRAHQSADVLQIPPALPRGRIDGLRDRSRRPSTSPGQTSPEIEDIVVRRRKQLIEQGRDHGAQSIVWSLQRDGCPRCRRRRRCGRS